MTESPYQHPITASGHTEIIAMESSTDASNESHTKFDLDRFHPLFAEPDGDVILAAKGGEVLFRMHRFTLKMTSGFFKTMYNLPQCVDSVGFLTQTTYFDFSQTKYHDIPPYGHLLHR